VAPAFCVSSSPLLFISRGWPRGPAVFERPTTDVIAEAGTAKVAVCLLCLSGYLYFAFTFFSASARSSRNGEEERMTFMGPVVPGRPDIFLS